MLTIPAAPEQLVLAIITNVASGFTKKQSNFSRQVGFDVVITSALGRSTYPLRLGSCCSFCLGAGGGAQRVPSAFLITFVPCRARILRNIPRCPVTSFSSCVELRVKRDHFATNRETYGYTRKVGGPNVRLFLDSGIPSSLHLQPADSRREGGLSLCFWVRTHAPKRPYL